MDRSIFITSIPSLIINNQRRYKTNADCIALHLLPHSCVVISKYTGEVLLPVSKCPQSKISLFRAWTKCEAGPRKQESQFFPPRGRKKDLTPPP